MFRFLAKILALLVALPILSSTSGAPGAAWAGPGAQSRALQMIMDAGPLATSGENARADFHELRLLTEAGPPFNFPGRDGPEGFSVDIVRELLRRTGDSGAITFLPWARAYDTALHRPNTLIFTIGRTPERETLFRWVGPIATLDWGLFARAGSGLRPRSLEQARLLSSISTYRADARGEYLRAHGFANLYAATDFTSSVRMLLDGHVAAVVADDIGIGKALERLGGGPERVEKICTLQRLGLYLAFSAQTDPAVAEAWQRSFETMRRDGTVARLRAKWLPHEMTPGFDAPHAMQ